MALQRPRQRAKGTAHEPHNKIKQFYLIMSSLYYIYITYHLNYKLLVGIVYVVCICQFVIMMQTYVVNVYLSLGVLRQARLYGVARLLVAK